MNIWKSLKVYFGLEGRFPMTIVLRRKFMTKTETIGEIYIGEQRVCYTLEDIKRVPKVYGETRIPQGYYNIAKRTEGNMINKYREWFGKDHYMLWLKDVPDFDLILIHCGNTYQDSSGCVIAGSFYTEDSNGQCRLSNSRAAYKRLWDLVDYEFKQGNDINILILDEKGDDK